MLTDEQVLLTAIKQAEENDFVLSDYEYVIGSIENEFINMYSFAPYGTIIDKIHINELIFNKNWAKAFYGEECDTCNDEIKMCAHQDAWQYHLQQQVIADDPIDYIRQYLNK